MNLFHSPAFFIGFNVFVLAMLALDLGVFHRKAHAVSIREAAIWSAVWITISLIFGALVYNWLGSEVGLQYLTGYLIEKSLSVDNIFVFALLFTYFAVPGAYQHRVLFFGILGALILRGILIFVGATLIENFHFIIYLFGAFLVYTGIKMARADEMEVEPEKNKVVQWARRLLPMTDRYHGEKFFVVEKGRRVATPLFVVLLVVESTDLLFALDSIPAIFAITHDPFIVYTSNVFAILGLRALYFLLAGAIHKFRYLKLGLAVVLTFVGVKMLITDILHIPTGASLAVVGLVLAASIVASLMNPEPVAEQATVDGHPVKPEPVVKEGSH